MRRLLVGLAPTIVVLVHALAPPTAEAHWFGRWGGCYSPRYYSSGYGYGYSSCYRPAYYGCSNGYSNYYGNYGSYGYSPYGAVGGYGLGGNSALTTILAMSGGLGGASTSMYMTVPMSNGYGPAGLLQVPVGGGAGRPTYLQVPIGGGPGQPVYLQLEMGGGASVTPTSVQPRPLSSTTVPLSDPLTSDETFDSAAAPYVVSAPPSAGRSAAATTVAAASAGGPADEADGSSSGLFRFAVFERDRNMTTTPTATPAKTAGFAPVDRSPPASSNEPLDLGPNFGVPAERTLSDGATPWLVK